MDRNITKKRKLKEAEAVSNGIDSVKKSKKQPKTVPKPAEDNEDLEDEDVDEEDEEDEEEDDGAEEQDEDAAEDDQEEEEEDSANGTDLPAGLVPTLPPTSGDAASFDELKLSDKTMKSIGEMGFTKMTSIQRAVSCA